jgi:GTP 3',8-cyclase
MARSTTCLFARKGYDLKSMMRTGKSDEEIHNAIATIGLHRDDNYSEIRTVETAKQQKVEISFIVGVNESAFPTFAGSQTLSLRQ